MFDDCPFCNGKAVSQYKDDKARIKCSICGIRTRWYIKWYDAELVWNCRVKEAKDENS